MAGTVNILPDLQDQVTGELTAAAPVVGAVLLGGAALAFGIKAAWIGWRTGSKAMGKAGS